MKIASQIPQPFQISAIALALCFFSVTTSRAQDSLELSEELNIEAAADEMQEKYEAFEELLSGTKLIGTFTIIGQESGELTEEEYVITKVTKLETGDYWQFDANVKYGDNDYRFPVPLEVKWAGDTPMITLTDLTFLGNGPFSARVIFYNGKYAGTWSHGEVGGHMFGRLEKIENTDDGDEPTTDEGDGEDSGR